MGTFWTDFVATVVGNAVVIWFLMKLLAEKTIQHVYDRSLADHTASVNHKYDTALEELRSDLAKLQAAENVPLGALTEGQRQSHSHVLNAVETLWSEIAKLRSELPEAFHFLDVLLPSEFESIVSEEGANNRDLIKVGLKTYHSQQHNFALPLEARLFAGDKLYAIFFAYRQVVGRIAYLLQQGLETRTLAPWYDDHLIKDVFKSVFTAREVEYICGREMGRLERTLAVLEANFLLEARSITSGASAAKVATESVKELQDLEQLSNENSLRERRQPVLS